MADQFDIISPTVGFRVSAATTPALPFINFSSRDLRGGTYLGSERPTALGSHTPARQFAGLPSAHTFGCLWIHGRTDAVAGEPG